ncbi:MAG: VPLPA-CTERM sorting domain-containing protein [Parvularcula sp.]|nr:VPLPA-CTERM sorting domain-containing protein [Parvularcula sp.]
MKKALLAAPAALFAMVSAAHAAFATEIYVDEGDYSEVSGDLGNAGRYNPLNATGFDPLTSPDGDDFFSLGFGGRVLLGFGGNIAGNAVVIEATGNCDAPLVGECVANQAHPESASVYAISAGINLADYIDGVFADLQFGASNGNVNYDFSGLQASGDAFLLGELPNGDAQNPGKTFVLPDNVGPLAYILIVDTTDENPNGRSADGFDLVLVDAGTNIDGEVPLPAAGLLFGSAFGGFMAARRRRSAK